MTLDTRWVKGEPLKPLGDFKGDFREVSREPMKIRERTDTVELCQKLNERTVGAACGCTDAPFQRDRQIPTAVVGQVPAQDQNTVEWLFTSPVPQISEHPHFRVK